MAGVQEFSERVITYATRLSDVADAAQGRRRSGGSRLRWTASGVALLALGEKRLLRAAGEGGRERGQDTRVRFARRLDGCCPPDWGKWFKDACLANQWLFPRFRDVRCREESGEAECIEEEAYERA